MLENQNFRPAAVIGPLGELITLKTLPPRELQRWTPRRKAEIVAAERGGLISVQEACDRYALSLEEFIGWQRSVERSGVLGLRVTRVQHYRYKYARLAVY